MTRAAVCLEQRNAMGQSLGCLIELLPGAFGGQIGDNLGKRLIAAGLFCQRTGENQLKPFQQLKKIRAAPFFKRSQGIQQLQLVAGRKCSGNCGCLLIGLGFALV